jgi:hypothetical protein
LWPGESSFPVLIRRATQGVAADSAILQIPTVGKQMSGQGDTMTTSSITLTRDELGVFLVLLGLPAVNGLPQDMAADIPAAEAEIRFHCGEHTLHERGWLTYGYEQRPILHDLLVAFVGAAALPAATLMLQQAYPGGAALTHFFSRRPDLLVEHCSPQSGLYTFQSLQDAAALVERIKVVTAAMAAQNDEDDRPATGFQELNAESMAGFLSLATTGEQDAAMAVWRFEGGAPGVGQNILAGLSTRPCWIATAAWNLNQRRPPASRTVMVIESEAGFWLVESHTSLGGRVRIHRISGEACQRSLIELAGLLSGSEQEQEGEYAQLAA